MNSQEAQPKPQNCEVAKPPSRRDLFTSSAGAVVAIGSAAIFSDNLEFDASRLATVRREVEQTVPPFQQKAEIARRLPDQENAIWKDKAGVIGFSALGGALGARFLRDFVKEFISGEE